MFRLAWKGRPQVSLEFDDPTLPFDAPRLIAETLKDMVDRGEADKRKSTFFTVDAFRQSNWGFVAHASGGDFGSPARAVDVGTGQVTKDITADEAVLRDSRLVVLVPPSGIEGLIISEVQGNASLLTPFVNQLDRRLNAHGLKIHVDNAIADSVAWNDYLSRPDVGIQGIELVQKDSVDRTSFDDPSGVSTVKMYVGIETGSMKARNIAAALKQLVGRHHSPMNLVGLVGIKGRTEGDFDEEKIITVQDGKSRVLDVTHGWPRFVYRLSETVRPSEEDFLNGAQTAAFDVMLGAGIQPTGKWWPLAT
ncbi:hypothetical protein [Pseudarthrobacter sp. SSS035]|uniref:hypothetical protein n=1 Tax=Pseudarthrobacter sp. SSS035 TaxID=2931399 RepID=UPI00200C81B2|nr:hypothetical protein [Pseudarthrobacter sp. SSS035]